MGVEIGCWTLADSKLGQVLSWFTEASDRHSTDDSAVGQLSIRRMKNSFALDDSEIADGYRDLKVSAPPICDHKYS